GKTVINSQGDTDHIELAVKNTTPGETMGAGTFVVAYQFKNQGTTTYAVSDIVPVDESFPGPSDDPMQYSLSLNPAVPAHATDVTYRVVFRGKLGAEDDSVVAQPVRLPVTNFYITVNDCCNQTAVATGSKIEVEYYDTFLEDFQTETITVT